VPDLRALIGGDPSAALEGILAGRVAECRSPLWVSRFWLRSFGWRGQLYNDICSREFVAQLRNVTNQKGGRTAALLMVLRRQAAGWRSTVSVVLGRTLGSDVGQSLARLINRSEGPFGNGSAVLNHMLQALTNQFTLRRSELMHRLGIR